MKVESEKGEGERESKNNDEGSEMKKSLIFLSTLTGTRCGFEKRVAKTIQV